jgi:hypothetical protein
VYTISGSKTSKAMFAEEDIPEEFKAQVYECAKMFTDIQVYILCTYLEMVIYPGRCFTPKLNEK